jgi:quercetin dioxygenase-like cupin family protein
VDEQTATITRAAHRRRETWDDQAARGDVSWVTLLSGDITPTHAMSAGVAEFMPHGGCLKPHRHAQPEIYFILQGTGILSVDGRETIVTAGDTVFIPGDAEHGIRNETDADLRLFYVFPTDSFADIVYRFPD